MAAVAAVVPQRLFSAFAAGAQSACLPAVHAYLVGIHAPALPEIQVAEQAPLSRVEALQARSIPGLKSYPPMHR